MYNNEYAQCTVRVQTKTFLYLCVWLYVLVMRSVAIGCPICICSQSVLDYIMLNTSTCSNAMTSHMHTCQHARTRKHSYCLYLVPCTPKRKATPYVENQGTSACIAHLIHRPSLNCHMWPDRGTELNSEVMDLKLLSLNNGVSEAKCHVKSCRFSDIQNESNFF